MVETIPMLAVAGRPALHSRSPLIFRELFRRAGKRAAYLRVAAESAEEALSLFRALGMAGMNLTSPFKEKAATLVDELSDRARKLGAINSLAPSPRGGIRGENTDPFGVLGALAARGVDPEGARCLVIGAGGAGKAAAYALMSAGGAVTVANRTASRAAEVAGLLGCASASLDDLGGLAEDSDIIASTLASDYLPAPESWLPRLLPAGPDLSSPNSRGRLRAVIDADYKTGALARAAASRGIPAATGADWLLSQALPAYRFFMGEEVAPDEASARRDLAGYLADPAGGAAPIYRRGDKVALVGLMGAGKSAAGRALADLAGVPFVDTDAEIAAEAEASIPEIFAREGEAGFRAREARVLDRITSAPGASVISTGGGAPAQTACAAMLVERCLPVWLHVSPATAAERAAQGPGGRATRPLLASADPEARLVSLEAERRGAYASCAELLVSTEGRGCGEVAEIIHDEIGRVS